MIFISKNIGKIFEDNIKKSCPEWLMVYRPPDSAQSFNIGNENSKLRFSRRSPADFFFFDGERGKFYVIECKTFEGSCSFERCEKDKGIIHWYQIKSLQEFSQYKNVTAGFFLDFRKSDNTYFLDINDFLKLIDNIDKKSFNESDMLQFCSPILIEKRKLKVNYCYDIEDFLNK